jgi:DNA-binding IclR family transcriptional regulator
VLLASLPDPEVRRLIDGGRLRQRTAGSLIQPDEVWADVRLTRERGYSFSVEDVIEGVAAVGAPIRDRWGAVVGALSIAGILPHFDAARRPEMTAAVVEQARAISVSLGCPEQTTDR